MARIRTIKPDFFEDQKIGSLPIEARLLFIGLWVLADDDGNVSLSETFLRTRLFPYNPEVNSELPLWLKELTTLGMVVPYEVNNEFYGHIRNFSKHQRINRPSQQKHPAPPPEITIDSPRDHGNVHEDSLVNEDSLPTQPRKGKGRGEGGKGKGIDVDSSVAVKETDLSPYGDSRAFTKKQKPRERTSQPQWDSEDLQILKTLCEDLDATDLLDADWWLRILQLTDGTQVFVDKALRKYLAHQETLPLTRKHKNRKRGFMTWIKTDLGRETWRKSNAGR